MEVICWDQKEMTPVLLQSSFDAKSDSIWKSINSYVLLFEWKLPGQFLQNTHLESDAQCMAYILARWPLSVRRVRICIRPTGSRFEAIFVRDVSAAAFRASCERNKGYSHEFLWTNASQPWSEMGMYLKTVLQKENHRVRTSSGVSDITFSNGIALHQTCSGQHTKKLFGLRMIFGFFYQTFVWIYFQVFARHLENLLDTGSGHQIITNDHPINLTIAE